jgi:serine/threonine-protein kinase HipA
VIAEARQYSVWIHDTRAGTITQREDHTRFAIAQEYVQDPARPVLGLVFEQDLHQLHSSNLRLPQWFSNLLPEGQLRELIAMERGTSPEREMELLAQVGHDLPGAVRIRPIESGVEADQAESGDVSVNDYDSIEASSEWRFSLAGVGLKFSMLLRGDRLTMPGMGENGDWILKLPSPTFEGVPQNEYAMMTLAARVGIDVPEIRLVHRESIPDMKSRQWPASENWAYAVKRFDRGADRGRVHIEDFAQVRNVYADRKYYSNYETVGSIAYRGRDAASLNEFVRRLTLFILVSNGDAHLKNWSLIYEDGKTASLSPAYDIVSTACYRDAVHGSEDLGLKFAKNRRFDRVSLRDFERLERRLSVQGANLSAVARAVIQRVHEEWPAVQDEMVMTEAVRKSVDESIQLHSRTLTRS